MSFPLLNDTSSRAGEARLRTSATCVHEQFEAHARSTPQRCAIISDRDMSYGELDALANQLARHLVASGAQPGGLVAVCLERSVDMVAAILAILKAGGAFVALDPDYPKDRIAYVLKDTGAAILISDRGVLGSLGISAPRTILVDEERGAIASLGDGPLERRASLESLAYIIYTSGTTGHPKGVMVTHRNLNHYVRALGGELGLTSTDVYLHTASFAFSSSVRQLMLPLSVGARVVIASQAERRDPLELLGLAKRRGVTVVDLVPSVWRGCLRALGELEPAVRAELLDNRLRLCLSASEALGADVPRTWLETFGHPSRFVNMFGHTETTGIVGLYPVPRPLGDDVIHVPVGRPIEDTRFYLLDEEGQPVLAGTVGEVCIGGPGVALGYLNLPELTAQKFVQDPFELADDARMYKTGDLGRLSPSGDLQYLGRLDHQVKIRGNRVELGEVEAQLQKHPRVRQSVVVAGDDAGGDKRLIAYVALSESEHVKTRELRAFLKETLPDYMVPSAFLFLVELPLTPNGKVDRRALPTPDDARPDLDHPYLAARNDVERRLVALAEEVLGVRPIGVHDDLFDLGLTSLMAARFFAGVEKVLGAKVPATILFKAASVARIAEAMREEPSSRWSSLVPVQPRGTAPPLFCVHGGAGTILIFNGLSRHLGDDQPVYALQSKGLYGGEPPLTRIEQMATSYLREIRDVQPKGPYYLSGFCFGGIVAFEMAQQLLRAGEEVALLLGINAPYPLYNRRLRAKLEAPKPFLERQRENARAFLALDGRQRWAFLGKKVELAVTKRVESGVRRGRLRAAKLRRDALNWYHVLLKRPLTDEIREMFFLEMHVRASALYRPKRYPGRFVLIRAAGLYPDEHLGWEGYAARGLDLIEIGGKHGHHRDLMDEPHVTALAEAIAGCLKAARAGRSSSA